MVGPIRKTSRMDRNGNSKYRCWMHLGFRIPRSTKLMDESVLWSKQAAACEIVCLQHRILAGGFVFLACQNQKFNKEGGMLGY